MEELKDSLKSFMDKCLDGSEEAPKIQTIIARWMKQLPEHQTEVLFLPEEMAKALEIAEAHLKEKAEAAAKKRLREETSEAARKRVKGTSTK